MPGDFFTNKIFNSQIKKNLKDEGKTEKREIVSVNLSTNSVLNHTINTKNIKRFNNDIQYDEKAKICNKFPFQTSVFTLTNVIS